MRNIAVWKNCVVCGTRFGISTREDRYKREQIKNCSKPCGYEYLSQLNKGNVSGRK